MPRRRHPHQDDVNDELESFMPQRTRNLSYALASIFGMMQNDVDAESAGIQRCPKCDHHSLRRLRPDQKSPVDPANWRCTRCGNSDDEFGNPL